MNDLKIQPDDPRLTAHALGELEGDEAAAVAAAVAADPALQAVVEEIRTTAGRLTAALDAEPLPEPGRPLHATSYHTVRPARVLRFPYWATAGLAAAACLVLVITLREWPQARQEPGKKIAAAAENAAKASPAAAGGDLPGSPITIQFQKETVMQAPNESIGVVTPLARSAAATPTHGEGRVAALPAGAPPAPPATEIEDGHARITIRDAMVDAGPAAKSPSPATLAAARIAADNIVAPEPAVIYRPPGGSAVMTASGRLEAADRAPGADHVFLAAVQYPGSTFGVAVGTAAYGVVRRALLAGERPAPAAVRIEELVNSFAYDYAAPAPAAPDAFAATLEVASAPWASDHRLVRIGLKARPAAATSAAPAIVARDVRVQVNFNPAQVQAYRLLGYENGPQPGAGAATDIRAGQTVTALYEIIPPGVPWNRGAGAGPATYERPANPEPKTQNPGPKTQNPGPGSDLLTVELRYQPPEGGAGRTLDFPLTDRGESFADASPDFKFAAAVAGFGLVLRDSPFKGSATLERVRRWADAGRGADAGGDRAGFISLVKRAEEILPAQG